MDVRIERLETSLEGTFGRLYINDELFCYTGELPKDADNDDILNERSYECIPRGFYDVLPRSGRESAKFKYNHFILQNVPNRSYILMHVGNYCGSVLHGYKSDIEGCIILGEKIGYLNGQKAILNSKSIFNAFTREMENRPFNLLIEENF